MVGITAGQTMRLNVLNLLQPPPDPGINGVPPGPCRVLLSFRNAEGQPFTNNNGDPIQRVVELQAGQSAFLDLNADLFSAPPSTNADVASGPLRLQLRPFVRVLPPPDPDKQIPPGPCATMEVFDNTSGRTSIFSAGFEPPPDPDRGQ